MSTSDSQTVTPTVTEGNDAPPTRGRFATVLADLKMYRRAYLLTAIASFGGMIFGWDTGLIGGILTMDAFQHSFNLKEDSDDFANLQGNIVSVLQGGCFFGAAASFWMADVLGRKWSLIVADCIFLIGSAIQTACAINTTSLAQLYVGRFIGGFGVGAISAIVPTYIGENANKEIRGRCIGCMQLFNNTGIMLSYFVNYGMNLQISSPTSATKWRVPFALQMLPGVLLLAGMLFENESPRWLVEKNRLQEARRALSHVRAKPASDPAVMLELDEIVADFEGREKLSMFAQLKALLENKSIFYRGTLGIVLFFLQQWSGTNSINYYSPQIFKSIGLTGTDSGLFATGIYGVVKVVFTGLSLMVGIEQAGRKWSLIVGGLGQAFAMFYIGANQAVHPIADGATGNNLTGNNVFAIVCVYLYVIFFSFGWGPIPYILSSECSPNIVRSLTMALALMTQWLFNFVIAKITPIMLDNITYGTFLLFGACCLLMMVYAVVAVPETKGVPLERVHLLFDGGAGTGGRASGRGIVAGALWDTVPSRTRARKMKAMWAQEGEGTEGSADVKRVETVDAEAEVGGKKNADVS
ncbi:uncharacterized protein K452DRAFT_230697 [Aplosporella prunicola CBS 121167]|uniref:Major facilitator superfamily (MFS) profile domain-containing protein n=1 Tax=Aplosporella prunicola CBS 121167 TaxID=1176127 RepID=A0A6A6BAX8_9PEZI|nr:uncharacterized protein K452DRAFT_230697 [Aplosporella prunicola CBS 121167]KAF2140395.1 hypothetical protein K452DRAFT_230697 [Aplosporella prunicola CBS 121167]